VKTLLWLKQKWQQYLPAIAISSLWVGILLLVLSAGFAVHSWMYARSQTRAIGTVVENVATVAAEGTVYVTHVRFRLPNGELVNFVDPIRSSENEDPSLATGTVVPVLYPPGNPKAAIVATIGRAYFGAIVLGILGIVFFDLGLIFRFTLRRQRPQSQNEL
jgi:hypothetical protein